MDEAVERGKRATILFVDDDADILKLFTLQFEDRYRIYTAMSKEDVETYVKRGDIEFDIMICDQHLVDRDGLEVVTYMKEQSPQTIRMAVSAYRNFDRLVKAINEGEIHRFVVKPWNVEELEQSIDLALKSRKLETKNRQLVDDLRYLAESLESRNQELLKQKRQLSHLLFVLYDIQRESDVLKKLDLVARGIVTARAYRRAIIYLLDENLEIKAFRHYGLSDSDSELLHRRDPITSEQRKSLLQEKYRIGASYFIPFGNHGHGVREDQTIPSHIEEEKLGNWHPQDILLIPLYGENKSLVGLVSVDDPWHGKRPTRQELHLIELFAHEAGLIIEQEEIKSSMKNSHRIIENQNVELRGKKMIFHSLLSLNYLTRKTIDTELVIKSFKDYLIALFNADTFHLLLRTKDMSSFTLEYSYYPHEEGDDLFPSTEIVQIPADDSFINRLITERRPIFVNSLSQIGKLQSVFNDRDVRSLFSAPLVYNEQVLGIMNVGFQTQRNISLKLLEDFELFSSQLAGIIFQKELIKQQEESQRTRFLSTIQALAKAIEKKDPYTKDHCDKVREYSLLIAERIKLPQDQTHQLEISSILHDIGKIGISIGILRKETPLSADEYETIKKHPEIGEEILDSLPDFERIRSIIRHHQERFDGKGYPDGLSGYEIPVEARILSIADAYDAMTSDRPYRKALSREEAISELQLHSGIQWDPYFVKVFLEILNEERVDPTPQFLSGGLGTAYA